MWNFRKCFFFLFVSGFYSPVNTIKVITSRFENELFFFIYQNVYTVMFLSFWTDWSGQTVQTQIRVYTVCNSFCIFWMHYSKETPSCSHFRVITINFRVSEILGFLWYFTFRGVLCISIVKYFEAFFKEIRFVLIPF